jgi:hypothetical protein
MFDNFLDQVIPASVKNVDSVAFGSQHDYVLSYLKLDNNSDLRERLLNITQAVQGTMQNINFAERDYQDVSEIYPSSSLYFPAHWNQWES